MVLLHDGVRVTAGVQRPQRAVGVAVAGAPALGGRTRA